MPLGRRSFLAAAIGMMGLDCALRSVAQAAKSSDSDFEPGAIAPHGKVEISANLILDPSAVLMRQGQHLISGEGHTHKVFLSSEAWQILERSHQVIVRSDLNSGKYPHSHWVLVKVG